MNWLIEIGGNDLILSNIHSFVSSPHFSIFEDSDDHQSNQYFLRSSHLNGNKSAYDVISAVNGLIRLINGALAIEYGFNNYACRGSIKISRVFNTNKVDPRDSDWKLIRFIDPIAPSNPFIGIPSKLKFNNPYNYQVTAYVELCLNHEDVFNLLLQISNGFDWRNLYCIWDTVTHYCSGGHKNTIKFLDLDPIEISAFTGTVNSFGALGLEARHGVMGWGIPKSTVTREQAIDIINKVVSKYLKKRYCLNCKSKEWNELNIVN